MKMITKRKYQVVISGLKEIKESGETEGAPDRRVLSFTESDSKRPDHLS